MGDRNNGNHAVKLTLGPVKIDSPTMGVAWNYLLVNAGHAKWAETNKALQDTGNLLASAGAKAATSAVGAAIGATVGGVALPVIGSILGLAAGWLVGEG